MSHWGYAECFYGNENSMIVHTSFCEWASMMDPANLVHFEELHDALGAGYDECQFCIGPGRRREIGAPVISELRSNKRDVCLICGETRGVQAAHVVPRRHGGTATMPLCPNHHWNYDHGLLTADEQRRLSLHLKARA